ncbi:MAG: 30S ribosomal protein S5 [Nitrososphaerota archaeon]
MSSSEWVPRTNLGKAVLEGKITSINEVFANHLRIYEPQIVDILLPNLEQEVLDVKLTQKQTDAGERSKFKAIVVVGNRDGYVGLGAGKAVHVVAAIEKAVNNAKLSIIPIQRGCGSWECGCDALHSLKTRVIGKCGSVRMVLLPAPKGVGIVAGEIAKRVLELAGIKDCWTRSFGETRTTLSTARATFEALKNTNKIILPSMWG